MFTADPRHDDDASLIEEIVEVDAALEKVAGGAGTERGSGGMASKLAAAKIAAWSGVRAVIASAALPGVVADALAGRAGRHVVRAARAAARQSASSGSRSRSGSEGRIVVDAGARRALVDGGKSLLPAGVREVEGDVRRRRAVEIVGDDGAVFAKGVSRYASPQLQRVRGPPHRRPPRRRPPRSRPPRRPRRPALTRVGPAHGVAPETAGLDRAVKR